MSSSQDLDPSAYGQVEGQVGEPVDGRRARGQRRRAEIIDATLRVVERDGAAGVTHRTVATEAGITPSLTTYYFATLDDLLIAALSTVGQHYATTLRDALGSGDPLAGLAELIVAAGTEPGRGRALAERELSTLAARRPALRPVAGQWRDAVADIASHYSNDPLATEALVAAADGACAAVLLADHLPSTAHIRAVLARAVGLHA